MKPKKKPLLPVDIKLPERVLLEEGVMFVTLRTLDELERFWEEHKGQFELACEGKGVTSGQTFLREYEWVFGTSKSAVVRTVMRWGRSGIGCDFYDWAKHDPRMHECFFHDRDAYRDSRIERGKWSDKDEAEYLADYARRTPETYRGWWRFCDLPNGYNPDDWFNPGIDHEELFDPNMALAEVAEKLKKTEPSTGDKEYLVKPACDVKTGQAMPLLARAERIMFAG
ncbi:MAG: hypothetical protein DI524_16890, partial [Ectopseudomonas oleovorans]